MAADYDGTLATDGVVDENTIEALHRLRESGRRLILVTGRIIEQLVQRVSADSAVRHGRGRQRGVLYDPQTRPKTSRWPSRRRANSSTSWPAAACRGIEMGDVIVATWEPHETTVLQTIHDLGLELQIIFNKGAVMILPTGVNKATGLRAALTKLGISRHNTVGIGDAENDEAFLKMCEASAAVDNALEVVKKQVDIVTGGAAARASPS